MPRLTALSSRWIAPFFLLLSLSLSLSGCAETDEQKRAIQNHARSAVPEDPELAARYQRSCQGCHSRAGTRAPLTGDGEAWDELMQERGMSGLVRNTLEGYRGMPPMGRCMDCTPEDFRALIDFMARPHNR